MPVGLLSTALLLCMTCTDFVKWPADLQRGATKLAARCSCASAQSALQQSETLISLSPLPCLCCCCLLRKALAPAPTVYLEPNEPKLLPNATQHTRHPQHHHIAGRGAVIIKSRLSLAFEQIRLVDLLLSYWAKDAGPLSWRDATALCRPIKGSEQPYTLLCPTPARTEPRLGLLHIT